MNRYRFKFPGKEWSHIYYGPKITNPEFVRAMGIWYHQYGLIDDEHYIVECIVINKHGEVKSTYSIRVRGYASFGMDFVIDDPVFGFSYWASGFDRVGAINVVRIDSMEDVIEAVDSIVEKSRNFREI